MCTHTHKKCIHTLLWLLHLLFVHHMDMQSNFRPEVWLQYEWCEYTNALCAFVYSHYMFIYRIIDLCKKCKYTDALPAFVHSYFSHFHSPSPLPRQPPVTGAYSWRSPSSPSPSSPLRSAVMLSFVWDVCWLWRHDWLVRLCCWRRSVGLFAVLVCDLVQVLPNKW